jgi:transcriptional regulator with XRE-family HTH domain
MVEGFKQRAAELGLNQTEVASRTGLSQPRISRVFGHGVSLSFEVAVALSWALEIDFPSAYADATARAGSLDG